MSKAFSTVNSILISLILICLYIVTAIAAEEKPITITSKTLIADNKNNVAIFEGSVVAKSEDIVVHSDKMVVSYANPEGKITRIDAYGNVRAYKKERVIFSKEATYFGQEEKIVFTGDPKAIEGENVIAGTQIIYFLKDDRAVVEGSRVVLKKKQE